MSARAAGSAKNRSNSDEFAESYRSLRSTVKFATGDRPVRSVLVVDVDRDERSQVAERLAEAFAEAGDRCILIDTDTRTTADRTAGFFDLMQSPDAAVPPVESGRLARLGPGQAGTPDALAGNAFSVALDRLVNAHEFAILSSAPMPRFADALAIAPRVDAVILVVTSGGTRRQQAVDARDALERVGARILGVVMVEPKARRFW